MPSEGHARTTLLATAPAGGASIPVITTVAELRSRLDRARSAGSRVGLVPTMGALHRGHGQLVSRAADQCDLTVVSVFVNPLQFGAGEDFEAYPRDLGADSALAAAAGADLVFAPPVDEMYPRQVQTTVHVDDITTVLEGAFRPGHFDGVATVVAKLFSIVGPCRAYFGEKDWQQLAVVTRMASDLSMPVEVVGCPTVREDDGLALSSRNAYLTAEERAVAPQIHLALRTGAQAVADGETDPVAISGLMVSVLAAEIAFELEYAVAVDPMTLLTPFALEPGDELRLLVAARLGRARLIDNIGAVVGANN
jgi:pantoate--beta-alanine ligase